MSTARFETSLRFVLKWEGSRFTNDPDDHGGATRYGIIQREYDRYRDRRHLQIRSVELISLDEVRDIYRREYWDAVQGDRMPLSLDLVMFDSGVLMGVGRAIRILQQSLKIAVSGDLDKSTFDALGTADIDALVVDFLNNREGRLRGIVEKDQTQAKFLKGWLNRLNDLRQTVGEASPSVLLVGNAEVASLNDVIATARAIDDPTVDFRFEGDEKPADPSQEDLDESAIDLVTAISLANYGERQDTDGLDVLSDRVGVLDVSPFLTYATLPIDIHAVQRFLDSCMTSSPRVGYGLGAKISPHGAVPGKDFTRVDCSGFVRESIWRATSPNMNFPDGSVVQHDWIRAKGFERSAQTDAMIEDGKIRIAFLRPQEAQPPRRIGHVALVYNGQTLESHGSVGPDTRRWLNAGWQAKAFVYILSN